MIVPVVGVVVAAVMSSLKPLPAFQARLRFYPNKILMIIAGFCREPFQTNFLGLHMQEFHIIPSMAKSLPYLRRHP